MKRFILLASLALFSPLGNLVKADFGEASFPENYFLDGPKSYHDGWCRFLNNECRIRFQGNAMWVEGVGGIYLDQFTNYRYDTDRPNQAFFGSGEHYNYITYRSNNGELRQALFLFANTKAQQDFMKAFLRWEEGAGDPIPNYRLPTAKVHKIHKVEMMV